MTRPSLKPNGYVVNIILKMDIDMCIRLRGFQEQLTVRAPEDPCRLFGEAVEATGTPSAECLSTVCTNIVDRTIPLVIEKLTSYIDDRLAHLDGRQRVNLNVRAPKRPVSQQPPIARDKGQPGTCGMGGLRTHLFGNGM